MATTYTLSNSARVGWTATNTTSLIPDTTNSGSFNYTANLTNGTGAGSADKLYLAAPTIAASGTLSLDLAGSLTDLFGATITFARVKGIFIKFDDTNTGSSIALGGAASNTATLFFSDDSDKVIIQKTGMFLNCRTDATGWPVTASTGDILKIENLDSSNSVILNIAIWGASS